MRARAVIGASFGDEGKGLIVDWLCAREGAGVVVRFNGGAQAGHTVVTPEGQRHVFQHVGAGAFHGVPTFLSQFFVCNPIMFFKETEALEKECGIVPQVFAHPDCLVTTFADMMNNQFKEDARGIKRHGSVGLGLHETMQRSEVPDLKITMHDLWHGSPASLRNKLAEICGKWSKFRTGYAIKNEVDAMIEAFVKGCEKFAQCVHPAGIGQCKDPIFEGAQGLLLDQGRKEFWPHVTHSRTGLANVRTLCDQAGITDIEVYYVSRTYLTRHGAGPLPGEDASMSFGDNTNKPHAYQGSMRFAPLDMDALFKRCLDDTKVLAGTTNISTIVLTHCDQLAPKPKAQIMSFGPTRTDVEEA